MINYDHLTESGVFAADTRPEKPVHTSGGLSPVIGKANYQMEINPWLFALGVIILTPACIYFGLLILTMTGLVAP